MIIKRMVCRWCLLILIVFFLSACSTFKPVDLTYSSLKVETKITPLKYAVYTPPNWEKGERLPLVLFLHGGGSTHTSFERYGAHTFLDQEINAGRAPRAIILIPRGGFSMWENWDFGRIAYRDWMLKELLPEIQKQYTTLECPQHCHMIGTSMGGFGAMRIAQLEGDKFDSISSISGLIFSYEKHQRGSLLFRAIMFYPSVNIFGYKKNSNLIDPYKIWAENPDKTKPRLQLIWGDNDQKGIIKTNQDLHDRLVQNNIKHDVYVYHGRHKWVDWIPTFSKALNFSILGDKEG